MFKHLINPNIQIQNNHKHPRQIKTNKKTLVRTFFSPFVMIKKRHESIRHMYTNDKCRWDEMQIMHEVVIGLLLMMEIEQDHHVSLLHLHPNPLDDECQ